MLPKRRDEEVFPNVAAIGIRVSSHLVPVPTHATETLVSEVGATITRTRACWPMGCSRAGWRWWRWSVPECTGFLSTRSSRAVGPKGADRCPGGQVNAGAQGRPSEVPMAEKLMSHSLKRAAFGPLVEASTLRAGRARPRRMARAAGQLSAAHARGASADDHAAHRGDPRLDRQARRHCSRARPAGPRAPPPSADLSEERRDRARSRGTGARSTCWCWGTY